MVAPIFWTAEMDKAVKTMWYTHTTGQIGAFLGIHYWSVSKRAKLLGLPRHRNGGVYEPSKDQWVATATLEARKAGVDVTRVLAGGRCRPIVVARWKSWQALLDANPHVSIGGLARVSGFDHASILHGLARLSGAPPLVRRPTGRRPRPAPVLEAAE